MENVRGATVFCDQITRIGSPSQETVASNFIAAKVRAILQDKEHSIAFTASI